MPRYYAMHCEMVAVGDMETVGKVTLVDENLLVIYDEHIKPKYGVTVTDYRTNITGIAKSNLDCGKYLKAEASSQPQNISYNNQPQKTILNRSVLKEIPITPMSGANFNQFVQTEINNILEGNILIGHNIAKSIKLLDINIQHRLVRDTAEYYAKEGGKPALKDLAQIVAGVIIHNAHDTVENAKAIMRIYLKDKF